MVYLAKNATYTEYTTVFKKIYVYVLCLQRHNLVKNYEKLKMCKTFRNMQLKLIKWYMKCVEKHNLYHDIEPMIDFIIIDIFYVSLCYLTHIWGPSTEYILKIRQHNQINQISTELTLTNCEIYISSAVKK